MVTPIPRGRATGTAGPTLTPSPKRTRADARRYPRRFGTGEGAAGGDRSGRDAHGVRELGPGRAEGSILGSPRVAGRAVRRAMPEKLGGRVAAVTGASRGI